MKSLLFSTILPVVAFFVVSNQQIRRADALTTAVRRGFVSTTNAYRSRLALGKQKNLNGTFLPKAKNMYQLVWHNAITIGCGVKQCPGINSTIAYCLYSPA
ncbi:hypothetical protein M3Y99_00101500 [Aphelenchoides fujianensis]|nr:hypothetical protein M3Y99_00101500 [Aphelenchoides fujianensis]